MNFLSFWGYDKGFYGIPNITTQKFFYGKTYICYFEIIDESLMISYIFNEEGFNTAIFDANTLGVTQSFFISVPYPQVGKLTFKNLTYW